MTKLVRIFSLLLLAAALTLPMWTSRFAKSVSAQHDKMAMGAQQQGKPHRDRKHMHMTNWMLQPTGIPGVFPLDPNSIPKFRQQLDKPPVHVAVGTKREPSTGRNLPLYEVDQIVGFGQMLPTPFPRTKLFAYGGKVNFAEAGQQPDIQTAFTVPGPTFEATRNQRIFVHYSNSIPDGNFLPVDPTIMGANPNNAPIPTAPFTPFPPGYPQFQSPVPTVVHLHGGVTPSASDGFPEAWFTRNEIKKGPAFTSSTFEYFNGQLATTLWYHDHTLGNTRLMVAAGLEGTYIIRDPNDNIAPLLPKGKFEMPLMLQDHAFNTDGSIHFTTEGGNPDIHPYWGPEYFGDTIQVNGETWPNMKVERHQYRFRIVNGSNARFYNLKLSKNGMSFIQIGADGSYLPHPVTLTEAVIAPSERADILIDFSNLPVGTKIVLQNDANAPFPDGDPVDPNNAGIVMRFEVVNSQVVHPQPLPSTLITIPTLVETEGIGNPKLFTLNEQVSDIDEPVAVLLDGQHFDADITEIPRLGTTEAWYFQNLSEDAHPIHVHLVEFQLEDRQNIDLDRFKAYWESLNGSTLPLDHPTIRANVEDVVDFPTGTGARNFLTGPSEPPGPREQGWKDTFICPPRQVTRVVLRFAPQTSKESDLFPGKNAFPFDPTAGPGYVWHCHILDHEDNDMMRPMKMTTAAAVAATKTIAPKAHISHGGRR